MNEFLKRTLSNTMISSKEDAGLSPHVIDSSVDFKKSSLLKVSVLTALVALMGVPEAYAGKNDLQAGSKRKRVDEKNNSSSNVEDPKDKGKEKIKDSPKELSGENVSGEKELKRQKLDLNDNSMADDDLPTLQERADNGEPEAQWTLGLAYINGTDGLEKNEKKAEELLVKAAHQGNPELQFQLARVYDSDIKNPMFTLQEDEENEKKAVYWYQMAADQDHPKAQVKLGDLYFAGDGVFEEDEEKAVYWYQKAAEQGYAKAQFKLGEFWYHSEVEFKESYKKAVYWYQMAAEQGYPKAQVELGHCYSSNHSCIEENDEKAVYWYQKAADQGYAPAYGALALSYEKGLGGLEKNLLTALNLHILSQEDDRPLVLDSILLVRPSPITDFENLSFQDEVQRIKTTLEYIIGPLDLGAEKNNFHSRFPNIYPVSGLYDDYKRVADYATELLHKVEKLESVSPGFLISVNYITLKNNIDRENKIDFKTHKELRFLFFTKTMMGNETWPVSYATFGKKNVEILDEVMSLPPFDPVKSILDSLIEDHLYYPKILRGKAINISEKCSNIAGKLKKLKKDDSMPNQDKINELSAKLANSEVELRKANNAYEKRKKRLEPQLNFLKEAKDGLSKIDANLRHIHRLGLVGRQKAFQDMYGLTEVN